MDAEHYRLLPHFRQRMAQRGLVWPDLLAVLEDPAQVRADGHDRYHRPKWIVSGTAPDELPVEFVCVIDEDDQGNVTVFITIY
ncbi:MAG: DUF4258 domain-containing protein [Planctomycetota bacterium]